MERFKIPRWNGNVRVDDDFNERAAAFPAESLYPELLCLISVIILFFPLVDRRLCLFLWYRFHVMRQLSSWLLS